MDSNMNSNSGVNKIVGVVEVVVNTIMRLIVAICTTVVNAALSSGDRGVQAMAGIGAIMIYYVSWEFTLDAIMSMDDGTGLYWYMATGTELTKVVVTFVAWGTNKYGTRKVKAFAVVMITWSIVFSLSGFMNANSRLEAETLKGSDAYVAEQSQRDSLQAELKTIVPQIDSLSRQAESVRSGSESRAKEVQGDTASVEASAQAAISSGEKKAQGIESALRQKLTSYNPAWIAKNATEVSGWRRQAANDAAAARQSGIDAATELRGASKSAYAATLTGQEADARRLEDKSESLRARATEINAALSGLQESASSQIIYTKGTKSILYPATGADRVLLFMFLLAVTTESCGGFLISVFSYYGQKASSRSSTSHERVYTPKVANVSESFATAKADVEPVIDDIDDDNPPRKIGFNPKSKMSKSVVCDNGTVERYFQEAKSNVKKDGSLPSFRTIGKNIGVTEKVARQAYGALVQQGRIDTQQGRGAFAKSYIVGGDA